MKTIELSNNIPVILKKNQNTPRHAMCFYIKIQKPEKIAGLYTILNRLFLQGTKNYSAQELAQVLDENAIECYSEMKSDFIRFKAQCLNEDVEKTVEILADIIKNSTLADFEKEIIKIKGEIQADLDEPKSKAMDVYYTNVFKNHQYGHTCTKILEEIDELTKQDVEETYQYLLECAPKIISVAGDFDEEYIVGLFNKHFSDLQIPQQNVDEIGPSKLEKTEIVRIAKNDASQAQIIQGWNVPTIFDKDYATLMVMNTLLGSCGLSSRLFLELREKKGLAYVVRSWYETYNNAGLFSVYIATEPNNIKTSLEGFKIELDKIKNVLISDEELENAKNNLLGKRQFFTETNMQQISLVAYYADKGLGIDFEDTLKQMIQKVTAEDVQRVANLYIKEPYVLTVLAPQEYLDF